MSKSVVSFLEPKRMIHVKREAAQEPNPMMVHRGPCMIKKASAILMHKEVLCGPISLPVKSEVL